MSTQNYVLPAQFHTVKNVGRFLWDQFMGFRFEQMPLDQRPIVAGGVKTAVLANQVILRQREHNQ
jgi:hypothetical protein